MPLWLRVLIGAIAFFLILALFGLLLRWAYVAIFLVALVGAIAAAVGSGHHRRKRLATRPVAASSNKTAERELRQMERRQHKEEQQILRRK